MRMMRQPPPHTYEAALCEYLLSWRMFWHTRTYGLVSFGMQGLLYVQGIAMCEPHKQ